MAHIIRRARVRLRDAHQLACFVGMLTEGRPGLRRRPPFAHPPKTQTIDDGVVLSSLATLTPPPIPIRTVPYCPPEIGEERAFE